MTFKTKKSLGQNFLKSEEVLDKIIEISDISENNTILEIGPGEGVLTKKLLETGAKIVLVEKDNRLIPVLEEEFAKEIGEDRLKLLHMDILEIEPKEIGLEKYKIVANIPYYITGQIIRKFLESINQPECMTLLVQKEVAERIVAKDGKESLLSISVKAYGEPRYIKTISKGVFKPQPKVDSAILKINNITNQKMSAISKNLFFSILHQAFSHKRKILISNLSGLISKERLLLVFRQLNIDEKSRAENISFETWVNLCKILSNELKN